MSKEVYRRGPRMAYGFRRRYAPSIPSALPMGVPVCPVVVIELAPLGSALETVTVGAAVESGAFGTASELVSVGAATMVGIEGEAVEVCP